LPAKTMVELGLDNRIELSFSPDVGNTFADDIFMPLTASPAIGLVDVLVSVIPVNHGEQLIGRIGDELGFAPGLLFSFSRSRKLFAKDFVFSC
jgi:hypothetical protein